jgi:hypothetical protein
MVFCIGGNMACSDVFYIIYVSLITCGVVCFASSTQKANNIWSFCAH